MKQRNKQIEKTDRETQKNGNKLDPERKMAFESLPPNIRENMSEEERELFLYAEEWPESMFKKLDEFILPK
ncbi:MAG: hypothetical protein HQK73_01105 [Desulfamplus sp.]|nr:hypothetical protein [Desulfamplus sp.]MBF0413020.1 hypothetical protein [Desulfamplus sp.]